MHCVIIGLTRRDDEPTEKRLFSYEAISGDAVETRHGALSPYLMDAGGVQNRHLAITEIAKPLMNAPTMIIGSKPIDGGYLILSEQERNDIVAPEPLAIKYIRSYIGGSEYLNGGSRWIFALQKASPAELRKLPLVIKRLRLVRAYREGKIPDKNKSIDTIKAPGISSKLLADRPTDFHVTVIPETPFLAFPEVSSERRDYIPTGWIEPPTIPSNKLRFVTDATPWHFGVLTSQMHMAWMRAIGGRLESRYQYSIGIVYNTFPWPQADDKARAKVSALAQAVLDARAAYPDCTLADLYDPDSMPPDLRKAHHALDLAVDKLYRAPPFANDRERVEHLFGLYEKLTANLLSAPKGKGRKRVASSE